MRLITLLAVAGCTPWSPVSSAQAGNIDSSCTLDGHRLFGKVQIVTSFPDLKVQEVRSFPDLKVRQVTSAPDSCGEWQLVTSSPDLKIQLVTSFPDLKIKYVDSFPGLP